MRITDQYFWNFIFTCFFLVLVFMAVIVLDTEAMKPWEELTLVDFTLMTLASWRLVRLFVYDAVTKFIREQFWNAEKVKGGVVLKKPEKGPRRTLADLFGCPWCLGVWLSAFIVFFYMTTEWAFYPVVFLAVSAVATYLQLLANLTGHRAEQLKNQNERGY